MNVWVLIYRLAWGLLGVLSLLLLGYVFYPPIRQFDELKQREARVDEDTRFQEQLLKHLKTKQEKLVNDPRFVERIAREKLGLSKPGETIYKFSDTVSTTSPVTRAPR